MLNLSDINPEKIENCIFHLFPITQPFILNYRNSHEFKFSDEAEFYLTQTNNNSNIGFNIYHERYFNWINVRARIFPKDRPTKKFKCLNPVGATKFQDNFNCYITLNNE